MQWEAFRSNPPTAICYRHVPWLPGVEPPGEGLDWERAALVEALGVDLKEQQLAWHPDKFTQRFGDQLHAADAERVMARWDMVFCVGLDGEVLSEREREGGVCEVLWATLPTLQTD